MGRIFLSAGHGGSNVSGTTEAKEMIQLRDLVVTELRSRGFEVLAVPDELDATQTIAWINDRSRDRDVALDIHTDAATNPSVRGSTVYYVANNALRKSNAELLLLALVRRVPQLPSRGATPDTATGLGSLGFCRQVAIASLYLNVGFLTNPDDRSLIQSRRRDMAVGIADGVAAWSRAIDPSTPPGTTPSYPPINININGQAYAEQGVLVNGNAYIPVDLVDRLRADLSNSPNIRRVSYNNVVYVKAIELRDFNISVAWDETSKTVSLRSIVPICAGQFDQIMSPGHTSEVQMIMFLKANNENALTTFPDLPKLYREEAAIEGVNYDIAFSQMCFETGYLRFGGGIQPSQNNFAGLGAIGGATESASFESARIGVRAHIQHLKAYASLEPLVQDIVDPRFRFVTRGIAPLIDQLSSRWSADPQYGQKVTAILRRLYESAALL